jgi:hypothetical protein
MAAKKRRARSKKKVTITIDPAVLEKLIDAIDALARLAAGVETSVDDAKVRKKLLAAWKKRAKRRR